MVKQAIVVLGAGASYDLMSVDDEMASGANMNYKPPLTGDIFSIKPSFQAILNRYPNASVLADTIRTRSADTSLETVLRQYSDSAAEHRQSQFREVPLYLQELLGEVSNRYLSRPPPNYSHLINQLLEDFDRVAFVTLNYDLLLERVLQVPSLGGFATGLDWYVQGRWLLVKLHGSVNWGRRIKDYPEQIRLRGRKTVLRELNDEGRDRAYLDLIGQTEWRDNLDDEVFLLEGHSQRWVQKEPYYPAIVVPVEEKYGFVCPSDHVEQLGQFMRECKNILVIGCSAKDRDLLDLLHDSMTACETFFLVGHGEQDVEETKTRLAQAMPQLRDPYHGQFQAFEEGFSHFVQNQGVERFAQYCPTHH